MKLHSRGWGRGSGFGLAIGQLRLGALERNCSPGLTVQAPLRAERGKEAVRLLRDLLVPCKGLTCQHRWAEVHEHGARGEDDVAVTLSVHRRSVALAKETRFTVAKVLIALRWARWAADSGPHLPPTLQPLPLLLLQLGLSRNTSCLEESLLPEITGSCRPDGGLLLLHLGQPGQQLVSLALRHLRVGQPGVHGGRRGVLRLAGEGIGDGEDSHRDYWADTGFGPTSYYSTVMTFGVHSTYQEAQ